MFGKQRLPCSAEPRGHREDSEQDYLAKSPQLTMLDLELNYGKGGGGGEAWRHVSVLSPAS